MVYGARQASCDHPTRFNSSPPTRFCCAKCPCVHQLDVSVTNAYFSAINDTQKNRALLKREEWVFLTLSILWIDQLTLIDDHHRQNLISFNPDIEKWPILGNQGKLLAFYISITAWFQFIGKISCRNKSKGSVARGQSRHISRIHKWKIVSANEWCGLRTLLDWGC